MSKRYPGNSITGNPVALSQTSNNGIWDLKDSYTAVGNNTWQEVDGIYEIPNSLRFRSATSPYLQRTPAVAGNRRTWTWSAWVKKGVNGNYQHLFGARANGSANQVGFIRFSNNDNLHIFSRNSAATLEFEYMSNMVFRDNSAWYHIVVILNTPAVAPLERLLVYVNGVRQTSSNIGSPTQNLDCTINLVDIHQIGSTGSEYYFDGNMAEVNFVDGQALDPTYFGYTDTVTGIWQPKKYTGGYGTNGYYLPFNQYASPRMLGKNYNPSNLLTYSEQLDNAAWVKPAAPVAPTVTANATFAPNGTMTADLVTFAGATTHPCIQEVTIPTFVAGDTYTASMYLKTSVAGTYNLQLVYFYTSGGNQDGYCQVVFDSTGKLTSATSLYGSYISSNVQYVGDGWYRVSVTNQWLNQGGALPGTTIRTSIGQGSGASSIYVWGAQLNLGNTADPYLQTAASSVNNSWAPNGGLVVGTNVIANTGNIIHSRYLRYTDGSMPTGIFAPTTNVFSGYGSGGDGKNNVPIRYTPPTPIAYNTLEIKYGNGSNFNENGAQLFVNLVQVDTIPYSGSANTRIYQATNGTLTSCGVGGGVSGRYESHIDYIKINGVYLTDVNYNCISPDSPTNVFTTVTDTGGVVSGNYGVWNKLTAGATYTEGNLYAVSTSAAYPYNIETSLRTPASGKFYVEVLVSKGGSNPAIGIGSNSPDLYACWRCNGTMINSISGLSYTGGTATWDTGDLIGMAYDVDTKVITFYKNGTSVGTFTNVPATGWSFIVRKDSASGDGGYLNCGQYPFAYTPPAGFKSLTTTNVQAQGTSAVGIGGINPSKYFDITLYGGTGAARTITNSGGFVPDLVWAKVRNTTYSHNWSDSVRGAGVRLYPDGSAVEATNPNGGVTSFNTTNNNGYNIDGGVEVNENGRPYVAWQWKQSPNAGLNIIPYTGTGVARTISHNLGVAPTFMIIKQRDVTARSWCVYHAGLSNPQAAFYLDSVADPFAYTAFFNNTAPTSSVFSLGTDASVNQSGSKYIGYLWAEVPGFSKFGSYVANNSSDGPFIYLGFKPKWILIRHSNLSTGVSRDWLIFDSARTPYNNYSTSDTQAGAQAIISGAPYTGAAGYSDAIDFVSNGFKFRNAGSPNYNASSESYVYAAFAESPFALNNRAI